MLNPTAAQIKEQLCEKSAEAALLQEQLQQAVRHVKVGCAAQCGVLLVKVDCAPQCDVVHK
jgi:hypothetical protein